jgi:hypothetical protein
VRGASPVGNYDLTNKEYVDTATTRTIVTAQFDGGNPLPANTVTEHFYVVTTSGANASIGDLIWDDGTAIGTTTVQAARARAIITTVAFAGGTISLLATSQYFWDTFTAAWLDIGGTQMSGALRIIRLPITNAASQDSATIIPALAAVMSCELDLIVPYSAGATITVGQAGSLTLLQASTDNVATVVGSYLVDQNTSWGIGPLAVRVTVGGAPAFGSGYCVVGYTTPDV